MYVRANYKKIDDLGTYLIDKSDDNTSLILFAEFLGVSPNTVKAWETGGKLPGGAACRLLYFTEKNPSLPEESGIIVCKEKTDYKRRTNKD